jgi:hypothetical protein
LKKVLIISPNFPPLNTADMQRVRQLLPYLKELGWEAVVIAVDPAYANAYSTDELLLHTVPPDTEIHRVKAWDVKWTRKAGLGSLSMRSYTHIRAKGDELLSSSHFDLVYISTTAFHVMALGRRWKRKFGVPFILDIQDPWRSDFYLDKPRSERPPKFFISYNIDKYLEKITVPEADGIISVSKGYCDTFLHRYPGMKEDHFRVIPFGIDPGDFAIMRKYAGVSKAVPLMQDKINIVYIGRGGFDMRFALEIIFGAFKKGLEQEPALFSKAHIWFVGTSYAVAGQGGKTIEPLADNFGIREFVTEIPDRIPYFDTLSLLDQAQVLLVPGSTDESYTASKIYPYVLAGRPLLAVFYRESSVVTLIRHTQYGKVVAFDHNRETPDSYIEECHEKLKASMQENVTPERPLSNILLPYLAAARAKEQVAFFNAVVNKTLS